MWCFGFVRCVGFGCLDLVVWVCLHEVGYNVGDGLKYCSCFIFVGCMLVNGCFCIIYFD